jgi:hypothetical protein
VARLGAQDRTLKLKPKLKPNPCTGEDTSMKKINMKRQLALKSETVRALTSTQIGGVNGGAGVQPTPDKTCWSAIPCPDYTSPCP